MSRPFRASNARLARVVLLLLGAALVSTSVAWAQATSVDDATLSVAQTESLVRLRYYEGLPRDQAARIGPEGCARVIEMLGDPAEARSHDNILIAIGLCAPTGAVEAIDDWLAGMPEGEIDRPRFKAWLAVTHALSALADDDPRALSRLESRMSGAASPRFRHGRHRGARLLRLKRFGAASGLAETGLPEAGAALDRANVRASDGEFVAHVRALKTRHRDRAEQRRRRLRNGGGRR